MRPEQLAMVTTMDLQKELMSRYDHAIFHGYKDRPVDGRDDNHIKAWGQKGDQYKCIGLGFALIRRCQNEIEAAEEDADTDDL